MSVKEDITEFVDKALPFVEYGRIVVEVKVVKGKPVSVNGMTHETIKRTKDLENEGRA